MTLPEDVCAKCNTQVFSPLDDELTRYVRTYAYWDESDIQRSRTMLQDGHSLWLTDEGIWISVRVDKSVKPIMCTQIIFLGEDQLHVTMDASRPTDYESVIDTLRMELSQPANLSVKKLKLDSPGDGRPAIQQALIRSARDTYLIRGTSEEALAQVERTIQSGTLLSQVKRVGAPQQRSTQIQVENRIKLNFGSISRALAKSALNFICKILGPEVARAEDFDGLRDFALTGAGDWEKWFRLVDQQDSDGAFRVLRLFAKPKRHTVVLLPDPNQVVGFILYGRPFAFIRLSQVAEKPLVSPSHLIAAVFDYERRTFEVHALHKDPIAFAETFPFPGSAAAL
jgi:hypothetical protein